MKKFKSILFLVILFTTHIIAQDTLEFVRNYLPSENKVLVFIPQSAVINELNKLKIQKSDPVTQTYPLMFLLHGYSGNFSDWTSYVNLQKYADTFGIIIVCPDGFYDSWYVDSPVLPNSQYQKFFWNDLVPALQKNYGSILNNKEIFITGLSMGGHGALITYLSNGSFFRAAGSMSGILDIRKFTTQWRLTRVLGNYEEKNYSNWDKNTAIENLSKIKSKSTCTIIIDCGTEDFAYNVNVQFNEKAQKMGIKVIFNSRKGAHDWLFWKDALLNHLIFFKSLCN